MIFITKRRINKLRAENGEIAVSENGIEIDINTGRAKRVYSPLSFSRQRITHGPQT